jgi:hypothetical protein
MNYIDYLRFTLICGVVFLHFGPLPGEDVSTFTSIWRSNYPVAQWLNSFFFYLFLSAVPTLALVSGYLFFRKIPPKVDIDFFLVKIRTRVKSLFFPMISWGLLWILVPLFLLLLGKNTYLTTGLLPLFAPGISLSEIFLLLSDLLWGWRQKFPWVIQFWFLHDLILTVLSSPILYFGLKRLPILFLGGFFLLWFFRWDPPLWRNLDVFFFFILGSSVAIYSRPLNYIATLFPLNYVPLISLFIILVIIRIHLPDFDLGASLNIHTEHDSRFSIYNRVLALVGVPAFLAFFTLSATTKVSKILASLNSYGFFVYAFHWPLVSTLKYQVAKILNEENLIAHITNILVTPSICIALSILLAKFLERVLPPIFYLLNGGRVRVN